MANDEVEIKFRIRDLQGVTRILKDNGFRLETPRTHEMNTLYDFGGRLRRRGELLRLRQYGPEWVLTHKAKEKSGRHKSRMETETRVEDGAEMDAILRNLGFQPSFRYEKFRAEWADDTGHVVIDETPIGNFGEIEGPAEWIDGIAKSLHVASAEYITSSYAEIFADWRRRTRNRAIEMTFAAIGKASGSEERAR